MNADVVVVGSGAAGLTAAIVAAHAGLKVILIEKARYFGGTTAYAGGGVWIPNNHHQKRNGLTDSLEQSETYIRAVMGNYYDEEKIRAYLVNAPEMLAYMEANTELKLKDVNAPDYEPHLTGAAIGRTMLSEPYDGRKLGPYFKKLRPDLAQMTIFNGMQIEFLDLPHFLNLRRSFKSFVYSARLFAGYVRDRAIHGRTARLTGGNALAARLLRSAAQSGVTLLESTPAVKLVTEGGRVTGVMAEHNGAMITIGARGGVVLASGGYGANTAMRNQHIPMAEMGWSMQPEENQGDGIHMGIEVGGDFKTENIANGIWIPISSMVKEDGTRVNFPHIYVDRASPGYIVVDEQAERFVDEARHYQHFVGTMHARGIGRAFLLCDHTAVRSFGLGLARPAPLPIGKFVRNGYLKRADTLAQLAEQLGLPPAALEKTIERFNGHVREGQDRDFQKPAAALGPIVKGPFYAVELRPGDLSTMNGLNTSPNAEVLNTAGEVIPGLYAAGLDNNSAFRGTYPGAGASLGPGLTFGFVAARHIAAQLGAPAKAEGPIAA